jgi:hypothetical protein
VFAATTIDTDAIDVLYKIGAIIALLMGGFLWIIRAEISKVRKETTPNHGSSMKDTVNQIHSIITALRDDQAAWRGEQSRHNDRLYEGLGNVHKRVDTHIHDHLIDTQHTT